MFLTCKANMPSMADAKLSHVDFKCSQCGVCCKSQKVALVTLDDIFRLAEKSGMKPGGFFKKYCMKSDKFNDDGIVRLYLKTEGGCPFHAGGRCSVHDVKPLVCSVSPFYFIASSLAAYRVFNMVNDECSICEAPYDTMMDGDVEKLVDLEVMKRITDMYMQRYEKFEEKTALEYLDAARQQIVEPGVRQAIRDDLFEQCVRREGMCRHEPYYRGATGMYLVGFHKEHAKRAADAKASGVFTFQPSALGTAAGGIILVLFEQDFRQVKKALAGAETGSLSTVATEYEGIEYVTATVTPEGGTPVMFYYYIDLSEKRSIRHADGEATLIFQGEKGNMLTIRCKDNDAWLK